MGRNLRHAWFAAAALALCLGAAGARADDDDCNAGTSLRLVNGKIHTMDKQDGLVSSVLIKNGRFAAVGRGGERDDDECTRTINLRGRTVVPGIIDSHNHIILLGLRPGRDTRLENANSIAEALATLSARVKEVQSGEWITSIGGFSRNQFFLAPQPTRFPTLQELSAAVPDHPVFIMEGFTGPGAVNQKAKDFLVTHGVPVGTVAGQDEGYVDGGAFGVATPCTTALFLLRQMQTRDSMLQGLTDAMRYAAGIGVTTHLDQGGFPFSVPVIGDPSDGAASFDRYRAHDSVRALYHEGKLTNRIWINFLHVEEDVQTPELRARLLNSWDDFGNHMLRALGIGEFTASAFISPGTPAWMNGTRLVAQAQWRNENHSLNFPVFALPGAPLDWKVIIDGWQVVNDELTDPHNPNRIPDGITKLRWTLAHVPVITPDYLQKLKNLGGGVNVLGGWRWLSGTATQNGPPFRDILASGIPVGLSSDGMQISTMSPWINLYYVVTGKNALGQVINGNQTLGRNEAMRLYTANNGWFLRAEDELGTIEEGKLGDLVVLSADYFDSRAVPDESIRDLRSVLTVVGGKVVYDDLNGRSQDYWKAGMP
ncbi:MAG TPA: amidohydrolase family protein [Burkholderiales bacterium]|nr:amidohydrolase family protein [Burkholderiales bacterium]